MVDAVLVALAAEACVHGRPLVRTVAAMVPPFNTFDRDGRAHLDLSSGPLVMRPAETAAGRVTLTATDAWGRAIARVAVPAGGVLITAPGWAGRVPRDAEHVAASTDVVNVAVSDGASPPTVHAHLGVRTVGRGVPAPDAAVDDELIFFERLRTWMAAFPPLSAAREYQRRFAPLGLFELHSPYVDPPPALRAALRAGNSGVASPL